MKFSKFPILPSRPRTFHSRVRVHSARSSSFSRPSAVSPSLHPPRRRPSIPRVAALHPPASPPAIPSLSPGRSLTLCAVRRLAPRLQGQSSHIYVPAVDLLYYSEKTVPWTVWCRSARAAQLPRPPCPSPCFPRLTTQGPSCSAPLSAASLLHLVPLSSTPSSICATSACASCCPAAADRPMILFRKLRLGRPQAPAAVGQAPDAPTATSPQVNTSLIKQLLIYSSSCELCLVRIHLL
jgi:hypothetical protein